MYEKKFLRLRWSLKIMQKVQIIYKVSAIWFVGKIKYGTMTRLFREIAKQKYKFEVNSNWGGEAAKTSGADAQL